eukprot:1189240-Prorocentrum_minimum.AAC.3
MVCTTDSDMPPRGAHASRGGRPLARIRAADGSHHTHGRPTRVPRRLRRTIVRGAAALLPPPSLPPFGKPLRLELC